MMTDLKKLVFDALDATMVNGYSKETLSDTPENVAINLIDYDYDIGEAQPAVMDLVPHIEAWRDARKAS